MPCNANISQTGMYLHVYSFKFLSDMSARKSQTVLEKLACRGTKQLSNISILETYWGIRKCLNISISPVLLMFNKAKPRRSVASVGGCWFEPPARPIFFSED